MIFKLEGVNKIHFVFKFYGRDLCSSYYEPNIVSLKEILNFIIINEREIEFYYIDVNNSFLTNSVAMTQKYLSELD